MAALVRHAVAVVLVREDNLRRPNHRVSEEKRECDDGGEYTHTRRQGVETHCVVILGQDRLDVRGKRREVALVEDRLDELCQQVIR